MEGAGDRMADAYDGDRYCMAVRMELEVTLPHLGVLANRLI